MPRTVRRVQPAPAAARALLTALLTSAALALSACGSTGSLGGWFGSGGDSGKGESPAATGSPAKGGDVETPSGETGQVVDIITPDSTAEPSPGIPPQPAETPETQGETMAAIPPEPAINDDPEQLIGMGPASLNAFLGAPELIRREAPASLWQYRAEGCVLDVVLYPDRSGDKVTYLEARENGETKIAPRTCLNKLLRARFSGSAG